MGSFNINVSGNNTINWWVVVDPKDKEKVRALFSSKSNAISLKNISTLCSAIKRNPLELTTGNQTWKAWSNQRYLFR